jgi:hypothetical protein
LITDWYSTWVSFSPFIWLAAAASAWNTSRRNPSQQAICHWVEVTHGLKPFDRAPALALVLSHSNQASSRPLQAAVIDSITVSAKGSLVDGVIFILIGKQPTGRQ